MNVIEDITNAVSILNKVDNYKDNLVDKLSEQDKKMSDLYHLIENTKPTTGQCYRIVKELKKQLEIRRKVKRDMSILSVYDKNINKLLNESNRNMLLAEVHKVEKRLDTVYQNRIYTDEELIEIVGVK